MLPVPPPPEAAEKSGMQSSESRYDLLVVEFQSVMSRRAVISDCAVWLVRKYRGRFLSLAAPATTAQEPDGAN